MNTTVESACKALDQLATAVKGRGTSQLLTNDHGWQYPAISTEEMAARASGLAAKIRERVKDDVDAKVLAALGTFPQRVSSLTNHCINQFYNPNAIWAYFVTIESFERAASPLWEWQNLDNPALIPAKLAKRAAAYSARLDELGQKVPDLDGKISAIIEAYDAAENLPVAMSDLNEARMKTEAAATAVGKAQASANEELGRLRELAKEAEKLRESAAAVLKECEETYRMTTAKGLAASFYQSSGRLQRGIWFWIVGLLVALGAGAWIGSTRLQVISELLKQPQPSWGVIWMNAILSVIGLGGPIWFAWLATKQIGQRFRLAEDYAYKAAVAQAYEGFRREAAKINPQFAERLMSSALSRLDEAPLRWVEADSHGSPWHELIESEAFRDALSRIPELRGVFSSIQKRRGKGKPKSVLPEQSAAE